MNISGSSQPILIKFSPKCSHCAGHLILVTDDVENVGQGQNLQNAHFGCVNISKHNSERQISLTVIGDQTNSRGSEFGVITDNDRRLFLLSFQYFSGRVETKKGSDL